jgi:hypothetical protein
MNTALGQSHLGPELDRRNMRAALAWCLAWALVFIAATYLLKHASDLFLPGAGRLGVAVVATAFSVAMVVAYARYVLQADELVRRIQVESLAVAFGATIVLVSSWPLLEHAGAVHWDIGDTMLPMLGFWVAAQLAIARRFQ